MVGGGDEATDCLLALDFTPVNDKSESAGWPDELHFFFLSLKRLLISTTALHHDEECHGGKGGVEKVLADHYLMRISKSNLMEAVYQVTRVTTQAFIKQFHLTLVNHGLAEKSA